MALDPVRRALQFERIVAALEDVDDLLVATAHLSYVTASYKHSAHSQSNGWLVGSGAGFGAVGCCLFRHAPPVLCLHYLGRLGVFTFGAFTFGVRFIFFFLHIWRAPFCRDRLHSSAAPPALPPRLHGPDLFSRGV